MYTNPDVFRVVLLRIFTYGKQEQWTVQIYDRPVEKNRPFKWRGEIAGRLGEAFLVFDG